MLTHLVFPKLENETLFYVFYYHKEDYEKNLAARELKSRGWLYHKKFGLWMKKADTKGVFE